MNQIQIKFLRISQNEKSSKVADLNHMISIFFQYGSTLRLCMAKKFVEII